VPTFRVKIVRKYIDATFVNVEAENNEEAVEKALEMSHELSSEPEVSERDAWVVTEDGAAYVPKNLP